MMLSSGEFDAQFKDAKIRIAPQWQGSWAPTVKLTSDAHYSANVGGLNKENALIGLVGSK